MIEIPQSHEVTIPGPDVLKTWLEDMLRIREFEVRSMQAYQNKLAGGFLHVYNGQEAVAAEAPLVDLDDEGAVPLLLPALCRVHHRYLLKCAELAISKTSYNFQKDS